jgi:septal ring factor EnvC (AmiA/AmiB activator)
MVAALAVVAALGAGFFGWRNMAQVDQLQSELNATKSALDKARGDLKKATQDLAAATKDATNLKVATDRLTMERDAVRATIENEQATGVRLRAELELAKDQISYLSARSSKEIVRGMPKNSALR